jgi:hypothetical protein
MKNNFRVSSAFVFFLCVLLSGCQKNREILWSTKGVSKVATYQNVVTRSVDSRLKIDLDVGVMTKSGAEETLKMVSWADRPKNTYVFSGSGQAGGQSSYVKVDFSKFNEVESLQGDVLRLTKELMAVSAISDEIAKHNPDVVEAQKSNRYQFLARQGNLSVHDTKTKANVLNFSCNVYELHSDNKKYAEYCMVRADDLQISKKEFDDFKWYFESSSKIDSSYLNQNKLLSSQLPDQTYIQMKLFDENGNHIMEQTLTQLEIRKDKTDPSAFLPPKEAQFVSFEEHLKGIREANEQAIVSFKFIDEMMNSPRAGATQKAKKTKK